MKPMTGGPVQTRILPALITPVRECGALAQDALGEGPDAGAGCRWMRIADFASGVADVSGVSPLFVTKLTPWSPLT
jgi:hypothetical protein